MNSHTRKKSLSHKPTRKQFQEVYTISTNKPGTAKVGALSKAQSCKKGDALGFVKLQLVAKYEKN